MAEASLPEGSEEAIGSGEGSSVPDVEGKPKTPRLAVLTEQESRHRAQMSELCKQVTDTNDQLNSLCFTLERLFKA